MNFGHTFGHALESLAGYGQLLHGEAVSIGIVLAARTSAQLGWLDDDDCTRIEALLKRAGLPVTTTDIGVDRILERMHMDKKASAAGLNLVLLNEIGQGVITPSPEDTLLREVIASQLAA